MLHALHSMFAPAVMQRLTLALNHVLAGEPVAMERLRPHAGRRLQADLDGWPSLLPAPPELAFRVTPAGLLEWCAEATDPGAAAAVPPDLHVIVDASNPAWLAARLATGDMPAVEIRGDAALAADVHWLLDHVRWDVGADLERVFGPAVGVPLARAAEAFGGAMRSALRRGAELAARLRPSGAGRGGSAS